MTTHHAAPWERSWSGARTSRRYIVGALAFALTISLLEAPQAADAAVPAAPALKSNKLAPAEARDIASARVSARLRGIRVEALSERTETSTTWVNKDGSLTTELAAGPIRVKQGGQWQPVDLTLAAHPDGTVAPKAHPNGLKLAAGGGAKARSLTEANTATARDLVTLGEGDQAITLQWKGGLPTPTLNGTRATYADAVPGADVVVEATRTGYEQFVEIKQRPTGAYSYTLPLQARGLKVTQQRDGSLLFTDRKNAKRAVMPAPVMWDASTDTVSGEHTRRAKVALKVVQRKGSVDLVLTPDATFLADPKTTYPVTVDPSTAKLGLVFDTYVQQGETVDWSADTELDLGNPGTTNSNGTARTARSFITWNTAPISDALVSSAKLSLWNFHSGNTACTAQPWEVWSAGKASTSNRWTAQPAWTAKKATSTETRGNTACTSAPDGWINADVTTLVQEWASAKNATSGMGLRATSETVIAQWKRVNSANAAANPPKLVVTYNYRPRTGTKQEAGAPYFSYGGAYVVNSTTPTLRDTFVDANGDKVNGSFQIFDSATDTQVGAVLVSPFVPSGQVASVKVPAGVLTNGKTYKFRTSPYDGTHYNTGWSAWKTFTVDTTAPSAPTAITSTDYPSDKWVGGANLAGTFTVTPPAADHNWLEWSLDGVTWTKVATGGASAAKAISVTPPRDGTHTLKVRAVDKADNKSEPLEYTFHAGPGGFVQPAEGDHTVRRIPLVAEADAAQYKSVTFSWRRSEADAWAKIPTGHVTSGGTPITSWPVPLTNGRNAQLIWAATDTVNPDGSIQIKADFAGPDNAEGTSAPLSLVVNRNGDNAASTEVGPGSLNLVTGDFTLAATDTSNFGMAVGRSASSQDPRAAEKLMGAEGGQVAIFGKEWLYGSSSDQVSTPFSHLVKTSATSLSITVAGDDTRHHFTANKNNTGWVPEAALADYTLTGSFTGNFTLRDGDGKVTVFTPTEATSFGPTWRASTSYLDGLGNASTTMVTETVTLGEKKTVRPKKVIAPTSAATAAACETNSATKGCRVLEFTYATTTTAAGSTFGDFAGQVTAVKLWSTAPGASAATAVAVSAYQYDTEGRLRHQWDPRLAQPIYTEYAYDGSGRVAAYQSNGEKPWSFTYGTGGVGGDGSLLGVSRAALKSGTTDVEDGTAVTSVVYDVPVTGAGAPYAMGPADVKTWGQTDAPTDATAVFPADAVPSAHSGGSLAAGDYRRATVHYIGASGQPVNTATPGGHITTVDYDRFGNTVRELTAANRALALGLGAQDKATLAALGIDGIATAERAELLSTRSVYGADGDRQLEELSPLERIELASDLKSGGTTLVAAGTPVTARPWVVHTYDEGRPTDGSAQVEDQVTTSSSGAQVREHPTVQGDPRVTKTYYDWATGVPTKSVEDPSGFALTTTTEYDSEGRQTKQVLPGGTGADASTRVSTYWSATGTGSCQGRPEWADLICLTGPAGTITGGGTNPNQVSTSTFEYDRWGNLTKTTETANGTTRTTVSTYDAAGRPAGTKVTGGVGQAVPEITTEYDPVNGRLLKSVSPTGGTIVRAYDKLGRQTSYTDADGGTTTSEYDKLDRPVKVSDSVPSSVTLTYDHAADPRGVATSLTDSVAGTFSATYDADGSVVSETLPGGYSVKNVRDSTGGVVNRTYTRDSDGTIVASDNVTHSAHGQVTRHAGWSDQAYTYDAAGRLATVEDTADTVCTTRRYTFDKRANRTALATATGTPGTDCPTTGGTSTSHTYDSADRIVDAGYAYDAFGRTTAMPGGATLGYYANDLAYQQTAGNERQTWQLDASHRFRTWTVESNNGGTWTQVKSKRNHYDSDGDSPRWVVEDTATGAITRNVESLGGSIAAATSKTGDTVLQLATIHGDVALQLPLDASVAPVVLDHDEYGNARAGQGATRYGWLGEKQRSAETPTGAVLMGVRLYNPVTGRFLSVDPVPGGNANPYEYCSGDPVNCTDLDGRWSRKKTRYYSWGRVSAKYWAPGGWGTGWGGVWIKLVANKRWTYRIGSYGWYSYTIIGGVATILSLVFPPAAPVIIGVAAVLTIVWATIQLIAQNASARGQCLHINAGASVWNKWYVPRYARGRWVYPWRGRC